MYLANAHVYVKKKEDEIKLWRETNDGMFLVRQGCKPEKGQLISSVDLFYIENSKELFDNHMIRKKEFLEEERKL